MIYSTGGVHPTTSRELEGGVSIKKVTPGDIWCNRIRAHAVLLPAAPSL